MRAETRPAAKAASLPPIPAVEVLSFLRETRGVSTWTARDMAETLKISVAEAKQVIAAMQMQGYVNAFKGEEQMTTFAGETVSDSKPPRYTRKRIEEALIELSGRIQEMNRDPTGAYRITGAVAFGDFLSDRTRFQSADVGIQLADRTQADKRRTENAGMRIKNERPGALPISERRETQKEFLKKLSRGGGILHLQPYQAWMSARSHRDLLK